MVTRYCPLRLLLFAAFCFLLCACSVSGNRQAFPVPDTLRMADAQRHEFIHLFLQGRWCEARNLFDRSVENFLFQDDFCEAAQNHVLFWKLKKYVGISGGQGLDQAQALLQTGQHCPEVVLPLEHNENDEPDTLPEKDRIYRELLKNGQFEIFIARLHSERDQLYASVYGRKAARNAFRSGDIPSARTLIEQTRDLDAKQGWIVFLIEDWRIMHDMTEDQNLRTEIENRVDTLRNMIQPCPF